MAVDKAEEEEEEEGSTVVLPRGEKKEVL